MNNQVAEKNHILVNEILLTASTQIITDRFSLANQVDSADCRTGCSGSCVGRL